MSETLSTRDRLIANAARLFQERGYHGVGVAEILAASSAPKGSLYYHFPNGKADLALAAADWASVQLLHILDDAFADARDFQDGITTLCFKLAKLFDLSDHWRTCPISSILFEAPENVMFRDKTRTIFDDWIAAVAAKGREHGLEKSHADQLAEAIWITLQGAWNLARARKSADPIRKIPGLVFGA
ncbi:TetR/AcrR family transcriptional regulator [Litoreibacter roseus]|uniref:TetR family transcriptional regulator n=1 Tax=Litoreibacter roseus TaxID=2601869 RepID=A0A6N6JEU0_9RHOB|nr:TetR/AcrR family transcriptional regulator [Litoreibacter roseus]GFE64871.1 TetR family transcriptional regulator [Litoreibacter roseus]